MLMVSKSKEVLTEMKRLDDLFTKDMMYSDVFEQVMGIVCDSTEIDAKYTSLLRIYDRKIKDTLRCDASEYNDNPYNKNIKFENINNENIEYTVQKVPAHALTLVEFKDSRYGEEFGGAVGVGYYSEDVEVPILKENDNIWMSPTLTEIRSIQKHIDKSHGNVCTIGLGIGYYVYMVGLKEDVEKITVVEYNPKIIEMFREYILPQFPESVVSKVNILQGDLFHYYNEQFLKQFDYVFIDTWKDNRDGLDNYYIPLMEKMLPPDNVGFWIEQDVIDAVKQYVFMYIKLRANNLSTKHFVDAFDGATGILVKKIDKYFSSKNVIISSKRKLLETVNGLDTIREILAC